MGGCCGCLQNSGRSASDPIADTDKLLIPDGMSYDYTKEAETLFTAFAERHGFNYIVEDLSVSQMDVHWTFPSQTGLSLELTLGLQNYDELNFGLPGFWSNFFPYEAISHQFIEIVDAWVLGRARIAKTGRWSRVLQVEEKGEWRTIYRANPSFFFKRDPHDFVVNERK
ncbi:MAG: hypothetical protein MK060_14480 [Blastomonas sp.]|uniref:hypothetical protein n=2 Tax=Blastomonas TaxID=150203 RepID=UPI0010F6C7DB|nr:hypothetical protein [Blastomonas sp.]MCH2239087.1 hypothetical protein [Blastomonas sp.]